MGTDKGSTTVTCAVCELEWQPHRAGTEKWGDAGFDVDGALNSLLRLQHSNHDVAAKAGAARDAYLTLGFKTVGPTLETVALCEETLRNGGFTNDEIAAANLDGRDAEGVAGRVSKRAALAVMIQHAVAATAQAQELFWCSEDPARDVALRVVRLGLLAMTGSRGAALPPLDCLKELRQRLLGQSGAEGAGDAGRADAGGDADKRRLMAMIGDLLPYVQRFGAPAAEQEASRLVRNLGAAFGDGFAAISQAEAEAILMRFGSGEIGLTGAAADFVLAAGAWGYVRDEGNVRDRRRLLQDLNHAKKRGQ